MSYDQEAIKRLFAKPSEPESPQPKVIVLNPSEELNLKKVINIPISELNDYPKQLFKPYTEEKLKKLEMSIRENGVIYPLIVRNVGGAYQIVCGHNRRRAAAQAGFTTVPCIVEELSDDEADIKMVETNLQTRDGLLPSEKAFAYKVKLEAIKHQGTKTEQALRHDGAGIRGGRSDEILASSTDESARQILRYIRLTNLITPLLDLVDSKSLQLVPAVELSYLSSADQEVVNDFFFVQRKLYIDEPLAKKLREQSQAGELTNDTIAALLPQDQGKTVKQTSKFSIPTKPLMKLLDTSALAKDVEKEILDVLIEYFRQKKNNNSA